MSWVRVETVTTVTLADGQVDTARAVYWYEWDRPADEVRAYYRTHRTGTWDGDTFIAHPGPVESQGQRLERVEHVTFHATRYYQPAERLL